MLLYLIAIRPQIDALVKEEVQKVRTEMMIKFKKENEMLLAQNRFDCVALSTMV